MPIALVWLHFLTPSYRRVGTDTFPDAEIYSEAGARRYTNQ